MNRIPPIPQGSGLYEMLYKAACKYVIPSTMLGKRFTQQRENGAVKTLDPAIINATNAATGNGFIELLQLSSEGDDPSPSLVTIGFFKRIVNQDPSTAPAGSNGRVIGLVTWGSGKGRNRALVDFTHGQRISITASSVQVSVSYQVENINGLVPPPPLVGPIFEVSAECTYNTISGNKAQFTDFLGNVKTTASTPWLPIPDFARQLVLADNGSPINVYNVEMSPEPAVTAFTVQYPRTTAGTTAEKPLAVPNGVEFYRITNGDTVDRTVYAIWNLFL